MSSSISKFAHGDIIPHRSVKMRDCEIRLHMPYFLDRWLTYDDGGVQ